MFTKCITFQRKSTVTLVCDASRTDHTLEFLGELITTEYVSSLFINGEIILYCYIAIVTMTSILIINNYI